MTTRFSAEMQWFEKGWDARHHNFPFELAEQSSNVPSMYRNEWEQGWRRADDTITALADDAPKFYDLSPIFYTVTDEKGNLLG